MPAPLGVGRKHRYTIGKVIYKERMRRQCVNGCCSNGHISQKHAASEMKLHSAIIFRVEAGSMPRKSTYDKMVNWLYKKNRPVKPRTKSEEIDLIIKRNHDTIFR
ncbi:hypothetical protein LCGC14_2792170, partial [marine sediment metagenome]